MPVQLNDKVVFVTGAASGIGESVTRMALAAGASVSATDIDEAKLAELADSLADAGDRLTTQVVDVTDEEAVKSAIEATRDTFGRIDGCFNNAGIAAGTYPLPDTPSEVFDRTMRINVYGVFNVLKHTLGVMRAQRFGSIVNTASVAGEGGIGNSAPYSASKHAVLGLSDSAAVEAGFYGVRVNAILPGWTWTPIIDWVGEDIMSDAERLARKKEELTKTVPLQRWATPEEQARVVLFMLSDEASYMVGSSVRVDGGFQAGYMS